jgi:hypothetical protein
MKIIKVGDSCIDVPRGYVLLVNEKYDMGVRFAPCRDVYSLNGQLFGVHGTYEMDGWNVIDERVIIVKFNYYQTEIRIKGMVILV